MLAKLAPASQGDCDLLDVPFSLLSTTVRTLLPSHPLSMPSITSGSSENSGYTKCYTKSLVLRSMRKIDRR